MDGTSGYEVETCPLCGALRWNGKCENVDCKLHWREPDEEDEEQYER